MEKSFGNTRQVIILGYVVVKFAKINFKKFWQALKLEKEVFSEGKKGFEALKNIWTIKKMFYKEYQKDVEKRSEIIGLQLPKSRCYEREESPLFPLLAGIMANWQEFLFTIFHYNNFIQPTYLSLFGLINIEKKGDKIDFWNSDDLFEYISKNSLSEKQPHCDSHVFANIENFSMDGNHLKIHDYCSRNVQEFLNLNGERLYSRFIKPNK